MIRSADRIMFFVSDMARAQRFYRDVLGLAAREEHPQYAAYDLGGSLLLSLHGGLRQPSSGSPVLALEVRELEQAKAKLKAAGAEIVREEYQVPGGTTLDLKDPDGHRIQLVRHD